jgi:hypothetical protein
VADPTPAEPGRRDPPPFVPARNREWLGAPLPAQLTSFVGGFTIAAADAPDPGMRVLDGISSLVGSSLLRPVPRAASQ